MTREEFYASRRAPIGTWKCKFCNEIFESSHKLYEHLHSSHKEFNGRPKKDYFCKYCGTFIGHNKNKDWSEHIKKCEEYLKTRTVNGGKITTEETKRKLSEIAKKLHAEGKLPGWNKRYYLEPSYPEKWIMTVIENEGIDSHYYYNMPFHSFFLDFAWADLKKVIEIDGEQHYRDPKQIERDIKKDTLLKEEGWKELRLSWRDIYSQPRKFIKIIKDFISNEDSNIVSEYIDVESFKKEKILEHDLKFKQKQEREKEKAEIKEKILTERIKYFKDIDTTKWGWVAQAGRDLNISPTQVRRWLKKYYPEKLGA